MEEPAVPPDSSVDDAPRATTGSPAPVLAPSSCPPPVSTASPRAAPAALSIYGVCLVAFDHAIGPAVEFVWPAALEADVELNRSLPFLALPDGAHTKEMDYSYFHLLCDVSPTSTVFGISCNRQMASDEVQNKGKDVTRSTVQKAIVVLASKPIFGPLRDKLGLITRAFFAQKDFSDKSILIDLYESLRVSSIVDPLAISTSVRGTPGALDPVDDDGGMYMGTSLRELVYKFRFKTLMLLKLLLLRRKVMFFAPSSPVESLCTFQYSLVALIPGLLTQLEDAASPLLDERAKHVTRPTSLRTSDKGSLIRYLGLPLNIFGHGAFFQPYLPLQQIDMLLTKSESESFLVGTTNAIFQVQRDCQIDVLVNIDTVTLEIADPKLATLLALTPADRKWMDEIVSTVEEGWSPADPSRPADFQFVGSDDFLRAKFEEYICSMLSCMKLNSYLATNSRASLLLSPQEGETSTLASFHAPFIAAFRETPAFKLWDASTDDAIFDLVEPRHPKEGKVNSIEDVGIRLAHGLHDLHLGETLAPTREVITRSLATSSETLWKSYSSLKTDLAKRQRDFAERREKERVGAKADEGESMPSIAATTVLAGVDVAKTQAASLAVGFSSFLSSTRSQLFAPSTPASPTDAPRPTSTAPLFGTLFRPLATAPLATSPLPVVAAPVASWGFPSFKRSFSGPSPPTRDREGLGPPVVVKDLDAEFSTSRTSSPALVGVATREGGIEVPLEVPLEEVQL